MPPQPDRSVQRLWPIRRGFVASGLGVACSGFGGCGYAAAAMLGASTPSHRKSDAKGHTVEEIRGGLHWVSDGAYNTMFAVSSAGVIACDAPPTLGANYLKAIAEVTDKPISHLVSSHEHVDHSAGAALFPADVRIVANRRTADLLASRRDPRRPVPHIVFDDSYTLAVGDQTLELSYRGINHCFDNTFIYAPRQRVLMLIDVVYPGWMPYKNLGVAVDIPGLVEAHRQALSFDFDTLVAGHVSRLGTRRRRAPARVLARPDASDRTNLRGADAPIFPGANRRRLQLGSAKRL
jgi:glyoxylase-like metal-dependent hydrolase (beta-lactamase superfamily II)